MIRYLVLYGRFIQFSFSRALEFRVDYYFRVLMDVAFYIINIAFFKVIYLHTPVLAGWNESQMMVFISGFILMNGLKMTIFSNNLWAFPQLVNKGDLDYYLVRPVSTLFFICLRDFAANSFVNVLMGFGILTWALMQYPEPLTFLEILGFVFLILNGVFLSTLFHLGMLIPVFWSHSTQGMGMLYYLISNQFINRPDRIFSGGLRIVLTTLLPMSLMVSFPARLLMDPFEVGILVHIFLVTLAYALFVYWLWRRGLRAYSSASS